MGMKRLSSLPVRQLVILSICRFAEPIALTSVFPYLYFMIKSFRVDEKDIAFYVGITSASFSMSQFFTGILWGRWSDRVGRKPTILLGLIGTMLANIAFGFSRNLIWAIVSRSAAGLLNGNVGIIRTMVAEMVPQKELQPRAFSIMPLVWSIGAVVGPLIGGLLSEPVTQHPDWFTQGSKLHRFFAKFPFLLPNLFVTTFLSIGLIFGFLFLEETLETRKYKPDYGRILGRKLVSCFSCAKIPKRRRIKANRDFEESAPFLSEGESAELDVNGEVPHYSLNRTISQISKSNLPAPTLGEVLTKQSQLNIALYTLLAFHSVAYDQILPVFMGSKRMNEKDARLPFSFSGGFSWTTSEIGSIFGVYGFISMGLQFFLFPPVTGWLGPKLAFAIVTCIYPLVYVVTPYLAFVPDRWQRWATMAVMATKSICIVFAFPCSTILLTNSAPSLRVLGTLNGLAVALSALGRATGPAIAGILYTWGMKLNIGVLAWIMLAVVAVCSFIPLYWIVEGKGFALDDEEDQAEDRIRLNANKPSHDESDEPGLESQNLFVDVEDSIEQVLFDIGRSSGLELNDGVEESSNISVPGAAAV